MKKTAIFAIIIALTFLSCDDFYSSSMGSAREYNWQNINLTTDNVEEWVQATVGNPLLAVAVTLAIQNKLADPLLPSQDKAIFLLYASRLAMESSGVGTSLLLNATDLLGSFGSDISAEELEATIRDMLGKLQDDFEANNGPEAAKMLAEMAKGSINTPNGIPKFDQIYVNQVEPTDVAEAVIVLLLGEMAENNYFDINNLDALDNLDLVITNSYPPLVKIEDGGSPSDGAVAIAAYLNLILEDSAGKFASNSLTGAIKDVLVTHADEYHDFGF